ncbi:MAG: 3-phosphoshikimate 1-carboxyvinyltransferase [Phycisphaerales bacterium]|nr:3-phosphoshikimate 1-carboxyvinyltransferase [Phycisphaerales bacterium]
MSPAGIARGVARLPGSKSLTNRLLACTALANGTSNLIGVSLSDDAWAMIRGLAALGVRVSVDDGAGVLHVAGTGGVLVSDDVEIDVGHAGTAMRFLTAVACLGYGQRHLDGSPRMRQRPIGALVEALQKIGARIGYAGEEGYPPLDLYAQGLSGGEVLFTAPPSSQFLSAMLMVAPCAAGDVLLAVDGVLPSRPYAEMTLAIMRDLGVEVLAGEEPRFIVPAPQSYRPGTYNVEPDASAATYMWAAAALTGGRVLVRGLTRASRQGDVGFVDVLAAMGCEVTEVPEGIEVAAPADGRLQGVRVDLNLMPDTVQTLAVMALFAEGATEVHNVANLRVKETDRLAALATELGKLGARVEVRADGLTIHPPSAVRASEISTYDDHRMAMSFALAGLRVEGVVIHDPGCVSKSFPGYFEALEGLFVAR